MRARVARGKRWAASGRQSVGSERASGIEQPVRLSDVDPVLARSARDPSAEEADATVSSVHALTLGSPRVGLGGGGGGVARAKRHLLVRSEPKEEVVQNNSVQINTLSKL